MSSSPAWSRARRTTTRPAPGAWPPHPPRCTWCAATRPAPPGTASARPAAPTPSPPPQPPPGRHLLSLALCNDLHIGETVAGLVGGVRFLRGVAQRAGRTAYPELMTRAVVDEARSRGAELLLAAGDISAGGGPRDLAEARGILDGFGTHRRDYFVVRGNHDRSAEEGDTFRRAFGTPDGPGYFEHDVGGLRIIGLDTYDKRGNGGDAGGLGAEQLSWFAAGCGPIGNSPPWSSDTIRSPSGTPSSR
ncbi:metallophosphoesterase family protein [Streptomyces sp. NPDC048254]|uniref:metallophosphoesterase family protein n=1 Tax=Streptomyces sp. NPDC048254 TaxID=3365525 RepID=UPI0037144764